MDILLSLFEKCFGIRPSRMIPLPGSGSNRRYFRLVSPLGNAIAVSGTDRNENDSFVYLSAHLGSRGINVPRVLAVSEDGMAYLQEDLGSLSLYDAVAEGRRSGLYSGEESRLLCEAVSMLPAIQVLGDEGLDYGRCFSGAELNVRMVNADLNYFKYCFLKTIVPEFDENALQDDFDRLAADLLSDGGTAFMYRDFQARNVMLHDGRPFFIDFQGGRRGPLHYDLASFIWQARAAYPEELKEKMLRTYLDALGKLVPSVDEDRFRARLDLFALFRTMQVLGAYGFRGLTEKKAHFIESIPYALDNLRKLKDMAGERYPYLHSLLSVLAGSGRFTKAAPYDGLTVTVCSFSFRKGVPEDLSGNGGGYVFDCRALSNPGRYDEYRELTGMDDAVIRFMENDGEVFDFLRNAYGLVDRHAVRFMERGFTSLHVSFGCTGGRHRSVYAAERMASHLHDRFPGLRVRLVHREQGTDRILGE